MTGSPKPGDFIEQARRASKTAAPEGELEWLENPAFIPAICFAPPIPTSHVPHAWERIAVPTAHSIQKIYKRIGAKRHVDEKYHAAVAELESQGFGQRKRMRSETFVNPYGDALYETRQATMPSGEEELNKAREELKLARQVEAEASLGLRNIRSLPSKQSTFDSAQLTWVPRKRHNTRWPVTPPTEDCAFIAELQPLIKFALHPDQIRIDEPSVLVQGIEKQLSPLHNPKPEEPVQQLQDQKPPNRRRTICGRPSLSTISEAYDEPPAFPVLTVGPKPRLVHASPIKASKPGAPGIGSETPAEVGESPMKIFTTTATHTLGDEGIEATSPEGRLEVPSSTDTNLGIATAGHPAAQSSSLKELTIVMPAGDDFEVASCQSHFRDSLMGTYAEGATSITPSASENTDSGTYQKALPLFDAPAPGAQNESQYEAKRRISLDNARRSDRRSDARTLKRVSHWMEGTAASNAKARRHSELSEDLYHNETLQKRRHTLDVDVGRNLDIFAQPGVPQRNQQRSRPEPTKNVPAAAAQLASIAQSEAPEPANQQVASLTPVFPHLLPLIALDESSENPNGSQVVGVDCQIPADVEYEVEKEVNKEMEGATIVMTDEATEAEDCTARVVIQDSDSDTAASEPNLKQHAENAAISMSDVVMVESEENLEGDSALADLHSFVRRAKSSKERKDAPPTTLILPSNASNASLSKKGRSGSMTPATSDSGSPLGKIERMTPVATTAIPRLPLGTKDANRSPSPAKKRKLKGHAGEVSAPPMKKSNRLVAPDLEDYDTEAPSQPKKRRRKIEVNNTDDVFNPLIAVNQDLTKRGSTISTAPDGGISTSSASRRSSRIATTTKAAAIPVRLPGSSIDFDLGDIPAPSTAAFLSRKAHKDLVTETRVNTRKNKGGAVPVSVALASLGTLIAGQEDDGTATVVVPKAGGKSVRWDEVLARVQGEDVDALSSEEEKPTEKKSAEEEDTALPSPPQLRLAEEQGDRPVGSISDQPAFDKEQDQVHEPELQPEPQPQTGPEKKAGSTTRRSSRAATSRLPTRGGGVVGSVATPAKKSTLPAPSVFSKVSLGGAAARARLGMAGPGTPGPRRGGRRKV